ncbi:MAG: SIMPL domain-containing protein, partial [Cyanobacteria bacterium REEB65]|nr:SIMPL domain-containing protein [Cyanobacteria bacterium REEB65]
MLTALAGALVVFTVIAAIFGLKALGTVGTDRNNISTISVDGTGWAFSTPDVATFSFTVTETAKTVADAQKAATDRINAALKAVRDQGVDDKDISTQSYNINPHYEYQNTICPASSAAGSAISYCPPGKSILTGYDVSETIQVKVRDLSKAGTIFSSIGSLGVQNVNGLDFSVDDPTAVQAEARRKAIDDAKNKAEVLAQ